MTVFLQTDWESLLKTAGPLGVIFILAVLGTIGAAKWFKGFFESAMADVRAERDREREDARKEREYMRQANEAQANKFLESLKIRDEIQEKGFDEILREIRDSPRRK